jgi:hypothetical protein
VTHYAAGRRLEYIARDELRRRGYVVIRAAGSKGVIDLVGIGPADVLAVQVKADGQSIGAAVRELAALPCPACVRREVWTWRGRAGWKVTACVTPGRGAAQVG